MARIFGVVYYEVLKSWFLLKMMESAKWGEVIPFVSNGAPPVSRISLKQVAIIGMLCFFTFSIKKNVTVSHVTSRASLHAVYHIGYLLS